MVFTTSYYKRAFEDKIRQKKIDEVAKSALRDGIMDKEHKYGLPFGFEDDYRKFQNQENLFRRLGTVVTLNNPEGKIGVLETVGEAKVNDENEVYPTFRPDFPKYVFRSCKLSLLSQISDHLTQDNEFDLSGYIYREFGRSFGRAEENVCLNGNGANEPSGLVNTAEIGVTADTLTLDTVIKLYFSLDKKYRRNAVWIMNDETALALRRLKDADGNYLWRTSDDTLISKPVVISNYIDGSVILFGDLSWYWFMERQPLAVKLLNEIYAMQGCIGLLASERIDGKLIRTEAVKILKVE